MIEIAGLRRRYGDVEALRGLSFGVERGDIFGFIGPNGAGKTTTIRILATLSRPDSGSVSLDGIDVLRSPDEARRRLGYMPDFFGVYDSLTTAEYLAFYASCYGIRGPRRDRTVSDLLELINLTDKRDAAVDGLSRGMKQRLCLARALVHDPAVLLLDEPASGLDPRARVEMRELLRDLRALGKTIVVSSHILPELAEMCTVLGIIDRGRMVATGPIDSLLGRAGHRRAALRVAGDRDLALGAVHAARCAVARGERDDELVLDYDGGDEAAADLLDRLVRAGVRVVAFNPVDLGLEELFLQLTSSSGEAVA